tara:strand:- start:902 stop:1453 length:552 start_codon:yes stop_codon:yes gene_type:complete
MENQEPTKKINSTSEETKANLDSLNKAEVVPPVMNDSNLIDKPDKSTDEKAVSPPSPKKPIKPPKLEDKPFDDFISNHFIPGLKTSIEKKGILVKDIKLVEGKRPVVGGNCWMVYCEISEQRRFWLCFNKELITSDKTILLAESNSDPSIVESFLIDEKKTTLPLLISRVLQRLNGQKWVGTN